MILKKSAGDKKHAKYHPGDKEITYTYFYTRELVTYRIYMCEVTLKACMHSYLVG